MNEAPGLSLEQRLSDLQSLAQEIYAARPDLQKVFVDSQGTDYWLWLQTHGCLEYPQVRELSVPVPPPEIWQFANVGDSWGFLLCGASTYRLLARIVGEGGQTLADVGPILDFGCGPGRGLRLMLRHAAGVRVVGTDVDAAAIAWCRANFPFGEFRVNQKSPPTDLPASTFGLVYAISVFSHLALEPHLAWLRELRRLARKGATVVLTVHGRHALHRALSEEGRMQVLQVTAEDLQNSRSALDSTGFAFVRQPGGHLDTEQYGITFLTEEFVRREWSKELEVVAYMEAALDDWQDAVVLRRRS